MIGLTVLWAASELFVKSSCKIAKEFNVPKYIVGILVTSIGTSLPELVLSLYAALTNHIELVIGNIVGSNIANIAVGLGLLSLCAKRQYVNEHLDYIKTDQHYLIVSTIFILLGCFFGVFDWMLGLAGLVIIGCFIGQQVKYSKVYNSQSNQDSKVNYKLVYLELSLVLLASAMIYFGAKWTVDGGVAVATLLGVPEFIIGLITIALGTSLPEIAVVFVACRKREEGLALGNIIGSNIYNVFFILALTGVITPLEMDLSLLSPTIIYLIVLTLLTSFALKFLGTKIGGILLSISYIVFVAISFY